VCSCRHCVSAAGFGGGDQKKKTVILLKPAMAAKPMDTRRKVSGEDTFQTSHR